MKLLPAIAVLKLDGYRPIPVAGDLRWDAKEAEAMRCDGCGFPGLRFAAFRRPGGGAHRGLAYCGACLTGRGLAGRLRSRAHARAQRHRHR